MLCLATADLSGCFGRMWCWCSLTWFHWNSWFAQYRPVHTCRACKSSFTSQRKVGIFLWGKPADLVVVPGQQSAMWLKVNADDKLGSDWDRCVWGNSPVDWEAIRCACHCSQSAWKWSIETLTDHVGFLGYRGIWPGAPAWKVQLVCWVVVVGVRLGKFLLCPAGSCVANQFLHAAYSLPW
jgi:hypothetical protein